MHGQDKLAGYINTFVNLAAREKTAIAGCFKTGHTCRNCGSSALTRPLNESAFMLGAEILLDGGLRDL